jgi:hypothetical protein
MDMAKANKKPGWVAPKATKRGNFLDDYTKMCNKLYPLPNKIPNQYDLPDDWKMDENTLKSYTSKNKVDMKADKNTYIGAIYKKQAKDKFPAPGAYNVTLT